MSNKCRGRSQGRKEGERGRRAGREGGGKREVGRREGGGRKKRRQEGRREKWRNEAKAGQCVSYFSHNFTTMPQDHRIMDRRMKGHYYACLNCLFQCHCLLVNGCNETCIPERNIPKFSTKIGQVVYLSCSLAFSSRSLSPFYTKGNWGLQKMPW